MKERAPEMKRFEASCTSDIAGIDHLTHTHTLKKTIGYLGESELGQLRFVTKFAHIDHFLTLSIMGGLAFGLV